METTLLQTKFYIPSPRASLVPRPRLLEKLNAGLRGKLTLIAAPAGFGKTTLVGDWLRQLDLSAAWLSLDKGDDDPIRFLTYFIAALQRVDPEIGLTVQAVLQSPQPPLTEALITTLINEIAASSTNLTLVLDDYHLINAQPIHDALIFLLDNLPPQMHLTITSRADPPLPLSRLRARGQMSELRENDLRLTFEEAATFLSNVMGLPVTAKEVQALTDRTEGWITGLQLAGLSMQGRDDITSFINSFTGRHRYILDYLTNEVLSQRPEGTRHFLLKTSILNRLCGSLCDAVTQQDNSQAILETLDAANLFLIALDDERRWYRYHHLFGNLLQHYLEREIGQEESVTLHQRAYDWYSQNGFPEESLEHALAAADFDRVVVLLEQFAWTIMKRSEISTLLRWLKKLPDELIRNRPRLSLYYAWMLLMSLRLNEIEPYVQSAEQILLAKSDSGKKPRQAEMNLLGEIDALRAFLVRIRGNASEALKLHHQALARMSKDHVVIRGMIMVDLGRAYMMIDELDTAKKILADALELNRAIDNIHTFLYAVSILAEVAVNQGYLHQAAERYQQTLQDVTARDELLPPITGIIYAGLAELYREWNDLDQASQYAQKAIELGEQRNFPDALFQGYLALGRIEQGEGEFEAARRSFKEAERIVRQSQTPQWIICTTAYQSRLWLMQVQVDGDDEKLLAGLGWAQTSGLDQDWHQHVATAFLPSHPPDFTHLTLARILIMRGEFDEALALLTWLTLSAEASGRTRSIIEILILQAIALHQKDQQSQAFTALEGALTLAESQGYVRLFADEGAPIVVLLSALSNQQSTVSQSYLDKLLIACGETDTQQATTKRKPVLGEAKGANNQKLIEPLSDRELEVLGRIAKGLSNREIAETLFVYLDRYGQTTREQHPRQTGCPQSHTGRCHWQRAGSVFLTFAPNQLKPRFRTEVVASVLFFTTLTITTPDVAFGT